MIIFILWLAVACVTSVRPLAAECENDLPVIGILSQALNEDGYPDSANYIASSYVKFVEMFAAQVVPILPNRTADYYDYLLERLNGILLPGGDVSLYNGSYHDFALRAMNYSETVFNENGEIFPILGICLGFEELVTLGAGQKVMSHTDSSKLLSPIEISSYGLLNSRLLQWAPGWLIETMESKPIAPNFHDFSLLSETYWANEELQEAFEVVAYGKDRAGLKFVSLVEGKNLPFIGYQFHPEKNLFEWAPDYSSALAHNFDGASVSQYLGDYFVQQSRRSCQQFDSQQDLDQVLIYNYNQTYSQNLFSDFHFTQMYIFDK